nr:MULTISPECIES: hypothetical protein [Pseudomonas]
MESLITDSSEVGEQPAVSLEQRFDQLGKRVRAASLAKTGLTLSAVEVQVLGMTVLANWQGDEDESEA